MPLNLRWLRAAFTEVGMEMGKPGMNCSKWMVIEETVARNLGAESVQGVACSDQSH